ncbi:response regulator [Galbitalea soli]|uniref:Response regulator transcription factor n=1 Tax=Galbitalea soli TaxID=1268042 RepID=A0A7C9PL82_9MICO|nr:response regulator transcription factor [Galbitalea soli]NYJ30800.1 two-component system OmpR family response regulator [Galbitalea soli]
MKILVVEDDSEMGRLTQQWLTEQGYETTLTDNGIDALIALGRDNYAAAAVDVMLPGMSGFELSRRIRDSGSAMPIILLTARDAVEDRVYGLDAGADDYLVKPFDFTELGARLRAIFRRENSGPRIVHTIGRLQLDSLKMRASVGQTVITMSLREFALLRLLASSAGSTVSRTTMLEEVWGSTEHIDPNIVEQYISFLRRKLDPAVVGFQIVTVRGVGYQLNETA